MRAALGPAADPAGTPRVTAVVVSWNAGDDLLECLESLLRSEGVALRVVVCDNASPDGSLDRVAAWARGEQPPPAPQQPALRHLSQPPLPKPLPFAWTDRAGAEAGGAPDDPALVLVQTGANLGFAGGANVGLRYTLARGDADWMWILNADTVVRRDALRRLVSHMQAHPRAGIGGSTLLHYDDPRRIHALGGARYRTWLGASRHLGEHGRLREPVDAERVVRHMRYVAGAAMLVPRRFLQEVGLLCEDYFLYFEELDWAERARGRFGLTYAPESVVHHKEGASAGTAARDRSALAEYYLKRNRLRFTRRHHPLALPTVWANCILVLMRRLATGRRAQAAAVARALLGRPFPGDPAGARIAPAAGHRAGGGSDAGRAPAREEPEISVVVIALNEERNLGFALRSVRAWADEVLVVDMHSEDRTAEVARALGARVLSHPRTGGFPEPARAFAIAQARGDWILLLDADELVPAALARRLRQIADDDVADVVRIPRRNHLLGAPLAHTGWSARQDRQIRFFRRGCAEASPQLHTQPRIVRGARLLELPLTEGEALVHFNYVDVSHFLAKLDRYTGIEAGDAVRRLAPSSPIRALASAARELAYRYVYRQGFRDGWRGFYLSLLQAFYHLVRHAKIAELRDAGSRAQILDRYRAEAEEWLKEAERAADPESR